MREFKFRFWDLNEEDMISDDEANYNECFSHEERIIPMQYTGLKDKNGKEIYEGDIVKRVNDTPITYEDGSKSYQTWAVYFKYGGWNFENTPISPAISYPAFYSNAEYMQVIGNIYENPELLGGIKHEAL